MGDCLGFWLLEGDIYCLLRGRVLAVSHTVQTKALVPHDARGGLWPTCLWLQYTASGAGFILQSCCRGWNPYVGDHCHHLLLQALGRGIHLQKGAAPSLRIGQHCTMRTPGTTRSCWGYTLDLQEPLSGGSLSWCHGIVWMERLKIRDRQRSVTLWKAGRQVVNDYSVSCNPSTRDSRLEAIKGCTFWQHSKSLNFRSWLLLRSEVSVGSRED